MNQPRKYSDDAGQAFPIYITVVAGLLFLAFAYLAVGQAAATRNGAQTAADAAALAAAQDSRDQLAGMWVKAVLDPTKWQDIFDGNVPGLERSCWRAPQLATQNGAHVEQCAATPAGPLGYTVAVKTDKPVGDSIVPGTENQYAKASATAVIEPLCTFELPTEGAGTDVLPQLACKDNRKWDLNPDDPAGLPGPEDLFDVHLAD
ncbi:pilus assembly protein TadG-related protein [Streptomyces sp. NRRL S-646]|uniref:pilus assembly protein TadG-related protein n=1 Tax=Streptomyces sp. NRRL S-646 TaxID=1463917 RepID=UPI0004C4C907|nr:pilus assembly protein TadG-related protein [Streptomyces sp. NRRL S-646]